jgi:hypothetical protein
MTTQCEKLHKLQEKKGHQDSINQRIIENGRNMLPPCLEKHGCKYCGVKFMRLIE